MINVIASIHVKEGQRKALVDILKSNALLGEKEKEFFSIEPKTF